MLQTLLLLSNQVRKHFHMKNSIYITIIFCLLSNISYAQSDTNSGKISSDIFDRIMKSVKDFQVDTTTPPDDKVTRKILELRSLRGGFNINEAIDFKIQEDRQKGEAPKEAVDKISVFFKSGDGKRWLDNAIIRIYREHFTYKELKQLVKFYRSSAGQKMASGFPIIMMQSLRAAEMVKNMYEQKENK